MAFALHLNSQSRAELPPHPRSSSERKSRGTNPDPPRLWRRLLQYRTWHIKAVGRYLRFNSLSGHQCAAMSLDCQFSSSWSHLTQGQHRPSRGGRQRSAHLPAQLFALQTQPPLLLASEQRVSTKRAMLLLALLAVLRRRVSASRSVTLCSRVVRREDDQNRASSRPHLVTCVSGMRLIAKEEHDGGMCYPTIVFDHGRPLRPLQVICECVRTGHYMANA
eukprot:1962646-Rhodomonas_salina.2